MSSPIHPAPVARLEFTTLDVKAHHFWVGHSGALSVLVWAHTADGDAMRRIGIAGLPIAKRYAQGRTTVLFVLKDVGLPTDEARDMLARYHTGVTGVKVMGVVLEGDGFWASALRATTTSMSLAARQGIAVKQTDSIEEIAPWLSLAHLERVGENLPTEVLIASLRQVRYEVAPATLFRDRAAEL